MTFDPMTIAALFPGGLWEMTTLAVIAGYACHRLWKRMGVYRQAQVLLLMPPHDLTTSVHEAGHALAWAPLSGQLHRIKASIGWNPLEGSLGRVMPTFARNPQTKLHMRYVYPAGAAAERLVFGHTMGGEGADRKAWDKLEPFLEEGASWEADLAKVTEFLALNAVILGEMADKLRAARKLTDLELAYYWRFVKGTL